MTTDADPHADAGSSGGDGRRRPVVRLRPKGGKRLAAGAPWVYADEIALDRRTRALAPGTVATLEGADRRPLATVGVTPDSTIAARVLDADPEAEIDAGWFAARLKTALARRAPFYETRHHRLVHAEGDGLPGVVIDLYGEAASVQPNAAWADARLDALLAALDETLAPKVVVLNAASRARALEGLDAETRVLKGALDGPVETPMNGATYLADLAGGQKTGLYYDQRPNHGFVARLARGLDVLDVFAHVGGFSLAALAAGASSALAVDGSAPALELATEGARRSGFAARFAVEKADAFEALRSLAEEGRRFGVVVCDPPAFAPHKGALTSGLRAYEKTARLAARVTAPGGFVTLCSCSHAADADAFRAACAAGLRAAGRSAALIRSGGAGPDHPIHPFLPETGYLKALTFALD